jgi:hypothetical protein
VKRTTLIAAVMTLGLTLSACGGDEEPTDAPAGDAGTTADAGASTATGDMGGETAAGSYADPACEEFYTQGGPLADRAEAARTAIENGEIVDLPSYGEVNLLEQRISAAAQDAPEEIAALLEQVNQPFTETVDAVNGGAADAETGEVTLPEIDVQASADAQAELETACQG